MEKTYGSGAPALSKDVFDKRKYLDKIINRQINSLEKYMNKIGQKKSLWDEAFIQFLEIEDHNVQKLLTGKEFDNQN